MKKKMFKLLGVLAIVSMLFAMVGCGKEESKKNPILGKWEAEFDMSKYMNESMEAEIGMKTEFKNLKLEVSLNIGEDAYELEMDEDSVKKMLENFLEQFKTVVKAELENAAAEYDMTLDDMISAVGYDSFDAYYEAMTEEMEMEDLIDEFELGDSGVWKYEDNKLWLGDGDDIDEDTYYEITLDGNTMVWENATGEEEEMNEYLLPLTFKKK